MTCRWAAMIQAVRSDRCHTALSKSEQHPRTFCSYQFLCHLNKPEEDKLNSPRGMGAGLCILPAGLVFSDGQNDAVPV